MVSSLMKEKIQPFDPYGLRRRPYLHFGQAIQWVREAFELTQGEFGALLEGVSQVNVARYEAGGPEPGLDFWRKFGRAFGVNLTWAITGGADPYTGVAWGHAESERMRHMIRSLYGAGSRGRNFNPLRSEALRKYAGLEEFWGELCRESEKRAKAFEEMESIYDPAKQGKGESAAKSVEDAASKKTKTRRRHKGA